MKKNQNVSENKRFIDATEIITRIRTEHFAELIAINKHFYSPTDMTDNEHTLTFQFQGQEKKTITYISWQGIVRRWFN